MAKAQRTHDEATVEMFRAGFPSRDGSTISAITQTKPILLGGVSFAMHSWRSCS